MTYQPDALKDDQNTLAKLPGWVTSRVAETSKNVAFLSGASFAVRDVMLTQTGDDVPHRLLRNTLALKAAVATSKLEGCVANFWDGKSLRPTGHTYPVISANSRKPDVAVLGNCCFRIMLATSMPSRVAEADLNDLNPHMCRRRRLINR